MANTWTLSPGDGTTRCSGSQGPVCGGSHTSPNVIPPPVPTFPIVFALLIADDGPVLGTEAQVSFSSLFTTVLVHPVPSSAVGGEGTCSVHLEPRSLAHF